MSKILSLLKLKKQNIKIFIYITLIFCSGVFLGFHYNEIFTSQWTKFDFEDGDKIKLCFTPPKGCGNLIVQEINKAQKDIFVQAYVITYGIIIDALLDAASRGVNVNILLDYKSYRSNKLAYNKFKERGINVGFDKISGLAHNKIIVIDRKVVITGSFNFSSAADNKNAENVILLQNEEVASHYINNWFERKIITLKNLRKYNRVTSKKKNLGH